MDASERNERVIRKYFEARVGWSVTKLDVGEVRAADFRICGDGSCFLCEVKTVESVRANYPGTPLDSHLERRQERLNRIEEWKREQPDMQLVLTREEWEYVYGDEVEFANKHRWTRRNTEAEFSGFAELMQDHFSESAVRDLPYTLRLDSRDLYTPNAREKDTFFKWLESELQAIDRGEPSRSWTIDRLKNSGAPLYSTSYRIHSPSHPGDVKADYQLMVQGPDSRGHLKVSIFPYGGPNLDAITRNVETGVTQLESSASRENDTRIARVIALAFESAIGSDWPGLSSHISWLLKEHPLLSAIAVLGWTSDGAAPRQQDGIWEWLRSRMTAPPVRSFTVYHSTWLKDVHPLPRNVFEDGYSVQLPRIAG